MACCTITPNQKRALEFDLPKSKRRRCGTMYTLQPTVIPQQQQQESGIIDAKAEKTNPFKTFINDDNNKINNNQLLERIRLEAKRLMKRRQLTITPTTTVSTTTSSPSKYQESSFELFKTLNQTQSSSKPPTTTTDHNEIKILNETPLFSIEQVNNICEKLLKEREEYLTKQYDDILNERLNEQYDTFVRFTHDQIQKNFLSSNFSYVS